MIDPTLFVHLAETIVPPILNMIFNFVVELLKYMQGKKESKARQERERETQQQERERNAKEEQERLQERKREAQQQEREREAQQEVLREWEARQQEREREAQQEVLREREARQQERERNAKEEQERLQEREREAQQQAREREAKKDQKNQAKLEFEQKVNERFNLIDDKFEGIRRDRMENQRNLTRKIESLTQTMDYAIKLFQDLVQLRHHSSSTLEYQERVKILAHFQLPEDSDEDLQNMFRASYIENPRHPLHTAESSKDPNGARNIEKELLHLAMTTTTKGKKNAEDITILDLHSQLFDDFEEHYDDDIASSVTAEMSNGTRAKEEGNTYFKEQKFDEAIKCYSKSIDELPTLAAYANRAMAYIKLNKFIEAEQDCTEALKIDDRYFKAYARRAMARTKHGCNFEGGLKDVEVALKLESNNQEMKELYSEILSLKAAAEARERGNKLYKDQKFEEAIICYTVSINISPTAVAYSNKAMAYLKLNKLMEAENDCTDALKIDNQCFKAYARRGIAREKLGCNLKGALEDVDAALNLEPNSQEMKELRAKLTQLLV